MKRAFHYRCSKCRTRHTLKKHIAEYSRAPKCRNCGCKVWYADRYRDKKELNKFLCNCNNGPYPHRIGSSAAGGRFGAWSCKWRKVNRVWVEIQEPPF